MGGEEGEGSIPPVVPPTERTSLTAEDRSFLAFSVTPCVRNLRLRVWRTLPVGKRAT